MAGLFAPLEAKLPFNLLVCRCRCRGCIVANVQHRASKADRCELDRLTQDICTLAVLLSHLHRWPYHHLTQSAIAPDAAGPLQSEIDLTLVTEHLPEYGDSFKQLTVQVTPETPNRLHVKIAPAGEQRWEVPETVVPRYFSIGVPPQQLP